MSMEDPEFIGTIPWSNPGRANHWKHGPIVNQMQPYLIPAQSSAKTQSY